MQNNSFNPAAASGGGGFEPPRGRTMNPSGEERKGAAGNGRDRDSSGEASLTRELSKSKGLRVYNVTDGEFSSFPEIMATSAQ